MFFRVQSISRYALALGILFSVVACDLIDTISPPADPSSPFQECDPTFSLYEDNQHFIHRRFIADDGTLIHKKWWLEAASPEHSPCNPIKDTISPQNQKEKKRERDGNDKENGSTAF